MDKATQKLFTITNIDTHSLARTGTLSLPHGTIQTPVFMPIGTQGAVKGLTHAELETQGFEIILGNTYHLWVRPDLDVMKAASGLHNFSSWNRPLLTDSGGFQAFSLASQRKFTEKGVYFKLPHSGEQRLLTPEKSMEIQTVLGSDIALILDQCLPAEVTHHTAKLAMERTHRWAKRCQIEFENLRRQFPHQNVLFGIPQGAQFNDLRQQSAAAMNELDFAGYSVGGVANGGEPEEIMYQQVLSQTEILDNHKPRHLLGVGTPLDIVQMVARGIDMFDCVYPTRNARHGSLIFALDDTSYEAVQITSKRFEKDFSSINPNSIHPELRTYSKAFLRHLFRSKELLAYRLATLQNLEFYYDLMINIRSHITAGDYASWYPHYKRVQ
jgi:queuine tRNA-ribosyltransferase